MTRTVESLLFYRRVPDLTALPIPSRLSAAAEGPLLSVIVPACNEQGAIEATVRALLASKGVPLEVIAIDDRSTDATGTILDRLAAEFAIPGVEGNTLSLLHIDTLPPGWLGKPHALAEGVKLARARRIFSLPTPIFFSARTRSCARCTTCNSTTSTISRLPLRRLPVRAAKRSSLLR